MFCATKPCYLHNCANVISGECEAGGVRNYYKYLEYFIEELIRGRDIPPASVPPAYLRKSRTSNEMRLEQSPSFAYFTN